MDASAIKDRFAHFDLAERLAVRRELAALPEVLMEGEQVVTGVQGMFGGIKGTTGLLVATDRRLLFVDCGLLWGRKVSDFPYAAISSVTAKTGLLFGSLLIKASNADAEITQVAKARVQPFADTVRSMLRAAPAAPAVETTLGPSLAQELERLAALRSSGALNETEFAAAKARLFGQ